MRRFDAVKPSNDIAQFFDVRAHFFTIVLAGVLGCDIDTLLGLHVHQRGGLAKIGLNFLGVENVKQHHFIPMETQRLDGADNMFRRIVKI